MEEFKISVYGENYDEEMENAAQGKANNASKKRKSAAEEKCAYYDWGKLADDGKVMLNFAICAKGILIILRIRILSVKPCSKM